MRERKIWKTPSLRKTDFANPETLLEKPNLIFKTHVNLKHKPISKKALRFLRKVLPNGLRYRLVGGTRERHFAGTSLKPRKLLENAQSPTSRVHAVLGRTDERQTHRLKKDHTTNLTKFYLQLNL